MFALCDRWWQGPHRHADCFVLHQSAKSIDNHGYAFSIDNLAKRERLANATKKTKKTPPPTTPPQKKKKHTHKKKKKKKKTRFIWWLGIHANVPIVPCIIVHFPHSLGKLLSAWLHWGLTRGNWLLVYLTRKVFLLKHNFSLCNGSWLIPLYYNIVWSWSR